MKDISLLLPKVQEMTRVFLNKCKSSGYNVVITSTYRDEHEQNALYAQGRTTPGSVVTNAKFGDSMHNYKVAIDFAPVDAQGNIPWNDKKLFMKIADIGVSCGFESGAYWTSFLDLPHLQYTAGYTLDDFKNHKVDYSKFDSFDYRARAAFALRDWQVSVGITDFEHVTDPYKIKFGPKSQALFNK